MCKVTASLTVLFEPPFWVGIFERVEDGRMSACKAVFGAEPKDYEIYEFVLKNYDRLHFGAQIDAEVKKICRNPKRIRRLAARQVKSVGVGTKAQQALNLQREQTKIERRELNREKKEERRQRIFELRRQKKKQKHKGK